MRLPGRPTLARLGAAAATGLIAAGSRPPVDIGALACIALVPLFVAMRGQRPRACATYAFVAGVVYYAIACSWIWYFGAVAIVPFVAICAGYWAAAGAVIGGLRVRRAANPFVVAAVWVLADALVARWPLGGLSWGELGYAFHDLAPARAVASVGGLTLVTLLAVALNALVADLAALWWTNGRRSDVWRAHLGVLLVAGAVVGCTVTRAAPHVTNPLRVALLQGNDKNRELTDAELDARYLPASHFDLATRISAPVDLVVFPESSMDADPRTDPYVHDGLVKVARRLHAFVLANASVDANQQGTRADNLDTLFAPDGTLVGTYSKRHLVPFGEYVPLRAELEGMISELSKVPRDFVPGKHPGLFTVDGTRLATVICFESAFGYEVRPLVHDGAQVLVVSTNNRSYRTSANSAQHLAIGQMRAAETGRPVVQAAISGITAVVDADGVVHHRTHLFDRTTVETTIGATSGQTPYVRYGEWAVLLAVVLLAGGVGLAFFRRRRRRVDASQPQETVSVAGRLAGYGSSSDVLDLTGNGHAPIDNEDDDVRPADDPAHEGRLL